MNFLSNFTYELTQLIELSKQHMHVVAMIVGALWLVHLVNAAIGYRLNILGILPRTPQGLAGIPCSPFLHGNFTHLLFNSVPLFLLIHLMLLVVPTKFYLVSVYIIGLSGAAVWLVGRRALHIGASSVILGYWGFLIMNIKGQPAALAVLLAFVCLYYLGGLVGSLFPGNASESWEGHVAGFVSGIFISYLIN